MRLISVILGLFCLILAADPVSAQGTPASEQKKIETLITKVERMTEAIFIRNGKSYSAALAAEFLRRKWRAHEQDIKSALDFIEKVASFSGHSGKPYSIRWPDGREKLCGEFLKSQLSLLEARS
ncbi:MAG TPA: DUF5329 family protein [Thermodesulfobacteriota bacterium]|nr:DUF5329 family protein [Thermodesulfobacteriota bacterium]